MWHTLIANLAVVAVFLAVWASWQHQLQALARPVRHLILGLYMGIGACISMVLGIQPYPGAILDLRAPLLAVAAYFGGPIGALGAAAVAGVYRTVIGGSTLPVGLALIAGAAFVGLAGYLLRRGRAPSAKGVVAVSFGVAAISSVGIVAIARNDGGLLLLGAPFVLLAVAATILAGLLIIQSAKLAADRDLLRAALTQAPDYHYVKDRRGRFAEVNQATATHNGFASPDKMVGRTDYDLVEPERAAALFEAEQKVMETGAALLEYVERVDGDDGAEKWFSTSKVPLRNRDGEIIGLAGVTRDVTANRRLEAELRDSRNLLSYVVEEMSDGLAMFDRDGYLVYCNDRYRELFPLTKDVRRPGVHLREILRAIAETGEQLNVGDDVEGWIEAVAQSLKIGGDEQVNLYDGRWVEFRTRATAGGAAMVVCSDITAIKKSEGELRELTRELRSMAATDGLTGLMNRRAFDAVLAEELERTARSQSPLSLILFDVDRFKLFNDRYGHPAGDECLKLVGKTLSRALLRQRDVAARYGGEEFAVILPDTDRVSAQVVAERVRQSLIKAGMPHAGSEHGIVTLSGGIATYDDTEVLRSADEVIGRADGALYLAKEAGRNRVVTWREGPIESSKRAAG